ncbi:hypothetical protein JCM6882_003062 [Rhodosporidiobolus microsporus]
MGFCRRCGEITTTERCKCGGFTKESTTRKLFEGSGSPNSDKWSRRYLSPASTGGSPSSALSLPPSSSSPGPPREAPTRTLLPPARPPSPSKLAQSFLDPQEGAGELRSVFGSVLSPKDHWQCCACAVAFKQEEVIYPHPYAKAGGEFAELFFCRQCFAERFRKGNCKKCKRAVLSDAPFVKHDQNVWHEECFACVYCENPVTAPVIDFAGRPSCEACFDAEAYRTNGFVPSPHLSQSEFHKTPISLPPAPSKWGRPSLVPREAKSKENVWTSTRSSPGELVGLGVSTAPAPDQARSHSTAVEPKPKAWRVQQERDRSPMVSSLNELGDKLRKAGFQDANNPAISAAAPVPSSKQAFSRTSPAFSSGPPPNPNPPTSAAAERDPPSPSPIKPVSPSKTIAERSSPWAASHSRSLSAPVVKPMPPSSSRAPPARAPLKAVQPGSTPSRAAPSPTRARFPTVEELDPATPKDDDGTRCDGCRQELGYGEFIELPKTGRIFHRSCFVCGGCGENLNAGKHVEADGKRYHHECAPPPPRHRAIVTSLAEPLPPSDVSDAPPAEPPRTVDLADDEPSCTACGGALGYEKSVTVPKSGKRYHHNCFTCAKCEKPFDKGFVEMSGMAYHEKCVPPPASPSPSIRSSPFFAADLDARSAPIVSSRSSRPISLPSLPSFPPKHASPAPSTSATQPSIFARRPRPPAGLGGLLVCAGCGTRATEKEVTEPRASFQSSTPALTAASTAPGARR